VKVIFLHSHKFRKIKNEYYSLGGLSDEVLERYTKYADKVEVIARVIEQKQLDENNIYSKITNPKVEIKDYRKLSRRQLKEEISSADRIIARLPCGISTIGIKIARKLNKEYLVEVVGCAWDAYWNHSLKGKIIAFWMFITMRRAVKNAPKVLYVSNEFLQKRYPTKGKQIACSDVVFPELEESVLEKREKRIRDTKNNNKIIIGTIGAVNVKYKGQEYVIKAIKDLKNKGYDIEYQVVGSGDNKYLQEVAEKNNVNDNVVFIGSLSHEKIFDWIDNIDIYVQPSKTEGLPRSLVEAMSRACPCIGSEAGGIPELLDQEYVFKKGKNKDLAKLIEGFSESKMLQQAKLNFEQAKKYNDEAINIKRNKFYEEFFNGR